MSVYVDSLFEWSNGSWSHMMADSVDELHAFAAKLGLKRAWFQDKPGHPHYDLRPSKRVLAVRLGAVEVSRREMVELAKRVYSRKEPTT